MTSTPSTRRQFDGVALCTRLTGLICAQVLRLHRWAEPDRRPVLLRADVGLRLFGCLIFRGDRPGSTSLNDPSPDDRLRGHRSRQTGSRLVPHVLVRRLDLRLRIERPRRPRRTSAQRYFKCVRHMLRFQHRGDTNTVRPESRQAPWAYPVTNDNGRSAERAGFSLIYGFFFSLDLCVSRRFETTTAPFYAQST